MPRLGKGPSVEGRDLKFSAEDVTWKAADIHVAAGGFIGYHLLRLLLPRVPQQRVAAAASTASGAAVAQRLTQMDPNASVTYTLGRRPRHIQDPLIWRGPISAMEVIHLLEVLDAVSSCWWDFLTPQMIQVYSATSKFLSREDSEHVSPFKSSKEPSQ
ncbi:hypothetical protein GOP47_0006169 [Adiantum capillus-veneris]|uniref:Uncharacterized protein n=1 Tax=Adiantum capillus-veneris TaxID=13818 RepID=A0A9D4V3C3_ADICA|nr:hypothetical protein GOP47_0006169 [Adiantum capillus-veneris]